MKKGGFRHPLFLYRDSILHKIVNKDTSVVAVLVRIKIAITLVCAFSEWVCNHAITSLKPDFWLEGVLTHSSDHL